MNTGPRVWTRTVFKRSILVSLVAATTLVLGGWSSGSTASSLPTSMTVATNFAAGHLDYQLKVGSSVEVNQLLNYNVTQTLLRLDHNHKLQPLLASSWKIKSPGVVEFTLAKGVLFSDGAAWNATAAKVNFDRMMSLKGGSYATEWASVYQTTVVDSDTIDVYYHPDPNIPTVFGTTAPMYSPKQIQNDPNSIAQGPIGTGPYAITSYNLGTGMTLTAQNTYFGNRAKIKTIHINFVNDEGARTAALKAGQADLVVNLQPSDVASFKSNQIVISEGHEDYNIRFGLHDPLSNDHRVREAISLAIDRSKLIKLFDGYATPAQGYQLWPSWVSGAFKQAVVKQNVAKAKQLIQKAGVAGQTVTIIVPTVRYPGMEDMAQAVQAMIEQIGLKVNVQEIAYTDWLNVTRQVTAPTTMIFGSMGYDTAYDATGNLVKKVMCGGVNSTYCSKGFDDLANQALQEPDATKRKPIIEKLTHVLAHEIPYIPLLIPATIYGKNAKLNISTYPNGFLAFANMTWSP